MCCVMSQAGSVAVLPSRMYSCVRGNADDYFQTILDVLTGG